METPTIKANNKTYKAAKPKAKVWRLLVKFQDRYGANPNVLQSEEAYNEMMELLAVMFNNKDVTVDFIEEHVDFDDIFTLFFKTDFDDIFTLFFKTERWLENEVSQKMAQVGEGKNAPATDS